MYNKWHKIAYKKGKHGGTEVTEKENQAIGKGIKISTVFLILAANFPSTFLFWF